MKLLFFVWQLGALVGCLHPFNLVLYGVGFCAQRADNVLCCR